MKQLLNNHKGIISFLLYVLHYVKYTFINIYFKTIRKSGRIEPFSSFCKTYTLFDTQIPQDKGCNANV